MGKIIAVSGPPGSGKTTVSVKLAQEIYSATKGRIIYFSPDMLIPALGVLFPTQKKEKLHSIGGVLHRIPLIKEDILSVLAAAKEMDNMGYLGYQSGEHPYTYPALTENKALELLTLLKECSDYLIVDCDRNRDNLVSILARSISDHVVYVHNPDIKSLLYYATEPIQTSAIKVLNILEDGVFLPVQEAKAHFGKFSHNLAYSKAVREQMLEGELTKYVQDIAYRTSLHKLAAEVLKNAPAQQLNQEQEHSEEAQPNEKDDAQA